ncbi:zf-HC2 domain-containing protein [Burkholderia ambifaria]|uniref:zf-HC2 domain-containing protein n=1 Tax=Burkholderia ambifaria TaxID=152480 RepID=UPI00158D7E05|nr:zf-HC2 domain-containing protein [Burkholderia ambifaria]
MLPGKCRDVTRLLSDALDRSLTLHERLQVRVHLPACSGCRAYRGQIALLRTAAQAAAGRGVGDAAAEDRDGSSAGDWRG